VAVGVAVTATVILSAAFFLIHNASSQGTSGLPQTGFLSESCSLLSPAAILSCFQLSSLPTRTCNLSIESANQVLIIFFVFFNKLKCKTKNNATRMEIMELRNFSNGISFIIF
jgi:hypothetical protein